MDWPRLLNNIAIMLLALQVIWLHFQLKKVVGLAKTQGQVLATAIWELNKKVDEVEKDVKK